jgi:hypothetical protein
MLTSLTFLALHQLANPTITIETRGEYKYISANGIPNHTSGQFPNRGNPNSIQPQAYNYRIPANPKENPEMLTPLTMSNFGIAINGVPFDPFTNEWWNRDRSSGWNFEAFQNGQGTLGIDHANAHVQPTGAYHYHGVPIPLIPSKSQMTLIGWAADGFPIYGPYAPADPLNPKSPFTELKGSYQLKSGTRPSCPGGQYDGSFVQDWEYKSKSGDLDAANGRFGITPEFPDGTYYYVVTNTYPWIPRFYTGTPDPSFIRRPGPPRRGGEPTHTHNGTTHSH